MVEVKKEGGKRGVEIEGELMVRGCNVRDSILNVMNIAERGRCDSDHITGAADMGGLQFFCTSVDEPEANRHGHTVEDLYMIKLHL